MFDVVAITGLRPTCESVNPTDIDKDNIGFDRDIVGFTKYMEHYYDQSVDSISDKDHITFLLYGYPSVYFGACP